MAEADYETDEDGLVCGVGKDILEYFDNLNWGATKNSVYQRCQETFIPDLDDEITHPMKLIDDMCRPFGETGLTIPPYVEGLEETEKRYLPGIENEYVAIPAYSRLNKSEQHKLYTFLSRLLYKKEPLSSEEVIHFQELKQRAYLDQEKFQDYVKTQWIKYNYTRTNEVPSSIVQYIDQLWEAKSQQCLSLYPHFYKMRAQIPLVLNDPDFDNTEMEFSHRVAIKGKNIYMGMISLKKRHELVSDYNDLCRIKPFPDANTMPDTPDTRAVLPVTKDPVVGCIDKDIDIVITPSAIKSIVDCHNVQKDWTLPIMVEKIVASDGKQVFKKVVYVDKKLPPNHMSLNDKNVLHAKMTAKWAMILVLKANVLQRKCVGDEINSSLNEELGNSSQDDDVYKEECKSTDTNDEPGPSSKGAGLEAVEPSKCADAKVKLKPSHEYNVWQLHKSKPMMLSKKEQRVLKVLVRTRRDGKLKYFSHDKNNFVQDDVYVSSKLEYQPEYGASKLSKSELLREYVDLYLRPKSKLARVRSVGHTREVMQVEVKTIQELKESLLQKKVATHRVFDPLYSVLTQLIDLPEKHYILRHTPKMGFFAQLEAENPNGSNMHLPKFLQTLQLDDNVVSACEIDPSVLTAIHHRWGRPPAVLQPAYDVSAASWLKKPTNDKNDKKARKRQRRRNRESNQPCL